MVCDIDPSGGQIVWLLVVFVDIVSFRRRSRLAVIGRYFSAVCGCAAQLMVTILMCLNCPKNVQKPCLVLSGSFRFFPILSGSVWFFPVLYGSFRFFPVLSGSIRFRPVLSGSLWFCMENCCGHYGSESFTSSSSCVFRHLIRSDILCLSRQMLVVVCFVQQMLMSKVLMKSRRTWTQNIGFLS